MSFIGHWFQFPLKPEIPPWGESPVVEGTHGLLLMKYSVCVFAFVQRKLLLTEHERDFCLTKLVRVQDELHRLRFIHGR